MTLLIEYVLLALFTAILTGVCLFCIKMYRRAVDLNPYKETVDHYKERLKNLQEAESKIEAHMKEMAQEKAAAESVIAKAEEEKQWLKDNLNAIDDKKKEIEKIDNRIQEKAQLEKDAITALEEANKKLTDAKISLDKVERETHELEMQQRTLEANIENLQKVLDDIKKDITDKENEYQKIASELRIAQDELNNLQREIDEKQKVLQALEDKIARKRMELEQIERTAQNEQNEGVKAQKAVKECEKQLKSMQQEADGLKIKIDKWNEELGIRRWEDLERGVVEDFDRDENELSEEDWLEEFQEQLNDHGIKFNKRLLYSFHTGLKVSDISPLVILAGISGTGKSLLPQLYAHAIGMNFIQMAVQPRWDSPQDILGFYNYSENRFKATELSRLLWQFDIYNNNNARKKYVTKSGNSVLPMNLVLLDEMNLARVEYYFSDLLSKLEVRRSVIADDDESRRAAELDIECGALKNANEVRRLFVGRNTLFVGTMNEDETTQSLSDKVMDRANVLRFGPPENLNAKPNTQEFITDWPHEIITENTWYGDWVKAPEKVDQNLLNRITEVNKQMTILGKPFGYRTWLAIRNYVANYPNQTKQGVNNAIADQFETRILSKLKGIDRDNSTNKNALDSIGKIIDDLGDKELSDAFNSAKDSTSMFFDWKGVIRKSDE